MRKSERRALHAALLALAAPWGAAQAARRIDVSGGVTAIALAPDATDVGNDQTLSVDLNLIRTTDGGQLFAYIEGNSSLDESDASTVFVEANADAGTALDPDRRGRIQLSELNYRLSIVGERSLTFGLIDVSSYFDRTRITNDENVQFLGASFVNNPTIEFPDYTLGAVYQIPAEGRRPQINAAVTASNGLADNPNLSYSQLIQFTDSDRGLFAAAGLGWPSETRLIRVGGWVNTRPHANANGLDDDRDNYGAYAVFGQSWGAHAMNIRLGIANEAVTIGSRFASLAYRYRLREHAVGVGLAHAFLSPAVTDPLLEDTSHIEMFARWAITPAMHLTMSAQKLRHSGFHVAAADVRSSATIAGIRLHYAF